ncbi:MAG: HDOD domain-containing protein [Verrucomicrobiae bacterium]
MATILLVDPSEVAGKAMQGILAHARHRGVMVQTIADAWKALHDLVKIDIIFLELELKGEKGIDFLAQLRGDSFLKAIPVVIYTAVNDQAVVRKVLGLKIQNYLMKPYSDEDIFREITKACESPWRDLQFEEEKSFCAQMGCSLDSLRGLRQDLMGELEKGAGFFAAYDKSSNRSQAQAQIDGLCERAELCGVWGVVDYMKELKRKTEESDWGGFKHCEEDLAYARLLISFQLNPNQIAPSEMTAADKDLQREEEARAVWKNADVDHSGPMITGAEALLKVDALPACPVIDSVAAAFQMTAEKSGADNLTLLNDLVARDPGLAAQVLIAANRLERDNMSSVDDPLTAVSLLGNNKLRAMAKMLPTVPERHVDFPPITWASLWMFQVGVGRVAYYTAKYLEFEMVANRAQTAGLLHDIGKLMLLRLFPFAFPAIASYAIKRKVTMHEAEKKYLGCTSREMGERFAIQHGLPAPYCNVIRWVESPELVTEEVELVGVVSLARQICLHNHVGFCGDTPNHVPPPIEETAAWRVLRPRVFPGFHLQKFSAQVNAFCVELKLNLSGRHST